MLCSLNKDTNHSKQKKSTPIKLYFKNCVKEGGRMGFITFFQWIISPLNCEIATVAFFILLFSFYFIWNLNVKSFSNETLNVFFRKFCSSYILDLAKTVWVLQILSQKSTRNFGMKELWAMGNHVLVNMLLYSSHFTEVHEVYIGT